MSSQRESVTVLQECIDLQVRKSQDYQNPNSNVVQAMHYRRGVSTIHDIMHGKMLRAQSLLEASENNSSLKPNFESLEDTYKDLINYASFAVSYLRGKMEGQVEGRDMFNRRLNEVKEDEKCDDSATAPSPQLLVEALKLNPIDASVMDAYRHKVKPLGRVTIPPHERLCSDNVIKSYVEEVACKEEDVGDRIEEDFQQQREIASAIMREGK